ncbi:MAG TPA: Rrf2 family transcriptional regulator [Flavisolibacter sp.]|jgi:Rrf2 family protein|nr:Rrf2 family transcriptional regulator [Flavisolibacter sp.]
MLSYTCKTAVKAVVYLATTYERHEKAGLKEVAEHIGASEHTVGKILQTLVRQDVINSMKGPAGGFYISKKQKKQPLINIVEAIDGRNIFKGCGLGLSRCSAAHPCPIHDEYKAARDILDRIFNTKSVEDLCEPVNNGLAYLFG